VAASATKEKSPSSGGVMKAYTDRPFGLLGDTPEAEAPIRRVKILNCTGLYSLVVVEGELVLIKTGYLYTEPARLEEFPQRVESLTLQDMMCQDCLTKIMMATGVENIPTIY
jgi:hypothetical protein